VAFIRTKQKEELEALIAEERLKPEETARFIRRAFQEGTLTTTGTEIVSIMPPTRKFGGGNKYGEMKARIIEKLQRFFERFFGLMRMGDD
jgi:type I restriction enzyme R subunit